ncbi:MAG TPA: hypothetical protein VFN21_13430 [Acidimicrobiales bacterium]|nr:hypothetical protein [Acidimicrobiales bacterium]
MVDVDEAARNRLYNELSRKLDESETLMKLLPTSQWDDLVTNDRLDARMAQVDTRFVQVDAKIETGFAKVDAKIERSTRTVIIWVVGAMFAFNATVIAILNAAH